MKIISGQGPFPLSSAPSSHSIFTSFLATGNFGCHSFPFIDIHDFKAYEFNQSDFVLKQITLKKGGNTYTKFSISQILF